MKGNLLVFFLLLLILFSIFKYCGTFSKGYNISEDHVEISVRKDMKYLNFFQSFESLFTTDREIIKRFRPVWVLHTILIPTFLRTNFLLYNVYIWILGSLTAFLLYLFCRNIGFSKLSSFLFSLLTILCPALVIWIEIAYAENIGMFFFALTLYLMSKTIYAGKNNRLYEFCFFASLVLMSLAKESFLIISPSIILLFLWLDCRKNNIGIIDVIKKNRILILLTALFTAGTLFYIAKYIGTDTQGYIGVNSQIVSFQLVKNFILLVFNSVIIYIIIVGIIIITIDALWKREKFSVNKRALKSFFMVLLACLTVMLSQFIAYYKTGFYEDRYYLPYVFAFSFFIAYLLNIINQSKSIPPYIKYSYTLIILIFLIFEVEGKTIPSLSAITTRCLATTDLIELIEEAPNDELLIIMDPVQNYFEEYSLKTYLDYRKGQKIYKYDFINSDFKIGVYADTAFSNKILKISEEDLGKNTINSTQDYSQIKKILIFDPLNGKFAEKNKNWFSEEQFKKQKIGSCTYYYK